MFTVVRYGVKYMNYPRRYYSYVFKKVGCSERVRIISERYKFRRLISEYEKRRLMQIIKAYSEMAQISLKECELGVVAEFEDFIDYESRL